MIDFKEIGVYLTPQQAKHEVTKVPCPFCSGDRKKKKDPSMSVWPQDGTYHCHHCGVKGKVLQMKEYKKPEVKSQVLSDNVVRWFNDKRKISAESLEYYGVTESKEWMPQSQAEMKVINFNYIDINNELVNIKYRSSDKKFKMFSGGKPILYGLNRVRDLDHIIITEGEMDCLAIHTAGVMGATSVPSGANKGNNNLNYIENSWDIINSKKKIILALDNDEAGKGLQDELLRRLGTKPNIYLTKWPEGCKDANDVLIQHGPAELKKCIRAAKQVPAEGIVSLDDVMDKLVQLKKGGIPRGDVLGYPQFDKIFSWKKDEMTIVTGAPNSGKSAFLDQCVSLLARDSEWRFGIISMEKPNIELHIAELMQRTLGKTFWNDMTIEEIHAHREYFDDRFKFLEVDKNELTVDHLIKKAEEMVGRYGIDCFVVDNWSFVELKMPKYGDSRTNHIGDSLTKFKIFKEKFKCAVIIVAHTRKLAKDAQGNVDVAGMYDIAESAHFANKADNVIVVYRNFQTGLVDIYTKKVRWIYTGTQGVSHFEYDIPTGVYTEVGEEANTLEQILERQRETFRNQLDGQED